MRKKKLTESEIRDYLTKNSKKYPNFSQFIKKDKYGAGIVAQVNQGTFSRDEIYTFWKKQKYGYTLEECIEVAKKCTTRSEMRANYSGHYMRVFKKRWEQKVFKYLPMSKKHKGYTFQDCKEIAKQCKHNNDMYKRFRGYHSKAERMGWLPKLFKKNYKNIGHTLRQCRAKARKCKTKKIFETRFPTHYNRALKQKWIDQICKHMVCGIKLRSITYKDCLKKAKTCKTRVQFAEQYRSHYSRAHKQGWLNDICSHMIFLQRKHELKEEKKLFKLLTSFSEILHRNILFKKYNSRPDFIILSNKIIWIIELKSDKSIWKKGSLKKQTQKYNKLGKKNFKPFGGTIIVSPKGKYGISYDELIQKLQKNFN